MPPTPISSRAWNTADACPSRLSMDRPAPPFRIFKPLRHPLILRGVARPALGGGVPSIIVDRHVDPLVDQELHRLVVRMKHQFVEDARRLVGTPPRVDVGAVFQQKRR